MPRLLPGYRWRVTGIRTVGTKMGHQPQVRIVQFGGFWMGKLERGESSHARALGAITVPRGNLRIAEDLPKGNFTFVDRIVVLDCPVSPRTPSRRAVG
jgi:hypothetical protein